jgi:ribosomal protein S18 acetylase RimI-like enzyme
LVALVIAVVGVLLPGTAYLVARRPRLGTVVTVLSLALYGAAAYVVDDPDAGVVAGAAGNVFVHPPGPNDLTTVRGHLYNVSTEPAFRRRGLARACVVALMDWFENETGVGQVELHATDYGIGLYRDLGFVEGKYPSLRFRTAKA